MKIKPLIWKSGNIGVHHQYAEGAKGIYHIWGTDYWAPPGYQKEEEASFSSDPKRSAQEHHEKHLKKFLR